MRGLFYSTALLFLAACGVNDGNVFVRHYGLQSPGGLYTVESGDTVGSLASRYDLAAQDIIAANDLDAPYLLSPGQRLALPPPRTYEVRKGDDLIRISRTFNVSQSQIVRLNRLSAPYVVKTGDILRLPPAVSLPKTAREGVFVRREKPPVMNRPAYAYNDEPSRPAYNDGYDTAPEPVHTGMLTRPDTVQREVLASPLPQPSYPPAVLEVQPFTSPVAATSLPTAIAPPVPPRAGTKFMYPVTGGKVLSGYGPKSDGRHNDGINLRVAAGTPVRAAESGIVVYADNDLQGYGNLVLLRHADRWMTAYAHMGEIIVKRGDQVRQGQTIGTVGATGGVDSPQLHFEIRRGTEALNPEPFLQ